MDEIEGGDDMDVPENEENVRGRITKKDKKRQIQYRTRFDVLATPQRRNILGTYQKHGEYFTKDRLKMLKHKLQELYAMTPEETEKYFEQMRNEANEIAKKKMMRLMLKKLYKEKMREKKEKKAYRMITMLLKKGMMMSQVLPVPPLITVRLRQLSDIIMEQLCDLRGIDVPDRDNPDQVGLFLMNFSDWMAIAIEAVYYEVQLKKNEELAQIEQQVDKNVVIKPKKGAKEVDALQEVEGASDLEEIIGPHGTFE